MSIWLSLIFNVLVVSFSVFFLSSESDISIETDFSGTTFTCAVIRGNTILCGNVGDSRSTLGYRDGATGAIVAKNLTIDHKPDLPAEKVSISSFHLLR